MRILLFGRNGQVARTFQEEAGGAHEIVALGSDESDLLLEGAAANAIAAHPADVIVNAAAYTAVDKAETDAETAARLNAEAIGEMAAAAKQAGAHFIHISTDYVFDGEAGAPYRETDAVNPLNVYGQTKLDGEKTAREANDQALILRTSWVFSEYGANFVKTMLRLAQEKDALNIVADQIGGPTSARDIAGAVLTIAEKKHRGAPGEGVYHYQGAPAVSWADFAREIFAVAEKKVAVTSIGTAAYPTPAKRPLYSVLDCAKIERDFGIAQPDWRVSLNHVINALKTEDKA